MAQDADAAVVPEGGHELADHEQHVDARKVATRDTARHAREREIGMTSKQREERARGAVARPRPRPRQRR